MYANNFQKPKKTTVRLAFNADSNEKSLVRATSKNCVVNFPGSLSTVTVRKDLIVHNLVLHGECRVGGSLWVNDSSVLSQINTEPNMHAKLVGSDSTPDASDEKIWPFTKYDIPGLKHTFHNGLIVDKYGSTITVGGTLIVEGDLVVVGWIKSLAADKKVYAGSFDWWMESSKIDMAKKEELKEESRKDSMVSQDEHLATSPVSG